MVGVEGLLYISTSLTSFYFLKVSQVLEKILMLVSQVILLKKIYFSIHFVLLVWGKFNITEVMSSRSINLLTPFLGRLRPPMGFTRQIFSKCPSYISKRRYFMISDHNSFYVVRLGSELTSARLAVRCTADCAMQPVKRLSSLTHCSRVDFSTLMYWKSPFAT